MITPSDDPAGLLPALIHLTEDLGSLASIVSQRVVRASRPFGAMYNHREIGPTQVVSCFSEIELADVALLASRHGEFGLGFHRRWMHTRGAAPVWYLPRESSVQNEFFEVVKSLAFRSDPDLLHFLWRFTPFIDYPQDGTTYDWRWEREWRVRGDLQFAPEHVAVLFAPERNHETIREMWLWEALDADKGPMPPLVDVRWSYKRQVATTRAGIAEIVSSLNEVGNPKQEVPNVPRTSLDHPRELPTETGWIVEMDDYAAYQAEVRSEQQAEWSHWLDEMNPDDD